MSHAYFVRRLTVGERREVDELVRRPPSVAVFRRAKAVQLSADGWKTGEIAGIVDRDRSAVTRWLHRFDEEGVTALEPRQSSGRPPKANEVYQAELKEAADSNPSDWGYSFTRWSLGTLREHLQRQTGIALDQSRVSRLLKEMGFRYGRPKLDLKHRQDPQAVATAKRLRTEGLKKRSKNPGRGLSSILMKPSSISIPS